MLRRILTGWNLFHRYQCTKDCTRQEPGLEFLFDGIELKQRKTDEVAQYTCETQMTYSPEVLLHLMQPGDEASPTREEVKM